MLRAVMVTCPSCGQENPERARFCLNCGALLQAAPQPAAEERKVVTVLFCDLVGFTQASDRADPEDVRARLRPYHARLRQEIERFGGTVEKFIGDAVMAVYGAPVAHEDDPERAVRSALRIIQAVEELNADTPGLDLSLRIGINTGEAVVALEARPEAGEGFVTGDVVNTASRLQSVAPTGGIVVGELTFRATERSFEYEPLEPARVKGKAEPVRMWQVLKARSRFGADVGERPAPLVGRQADLAVLDGAFRRAVQESMVQLVTVVGEPGVGKSRLVAELFGRIDEDPDLLVAWRQGRCLPYGDGITFWALGEIVKAEAGILESDDPDTATAKLDRALPEAPSEREWLRQRLHPLVGVKSSSESARQELFAAWRRFLEWVAETRPAVLVFEDLHWADDAMLAFLEHVAEWSEGLPILLVCTARPELFERHPTFAATARNATRINLAPLSDADTAKLVSSLLDSAVLPADIQTRILEKAEGNPLYAEELIRLLTDRGLLSRKGRTVSLAEGADVSLPQSVQALIAARLDTLSPERKGLLQDAAVVGKVFWDGVLAAMGDRDRAEVRNALHELSRKELVRAARSSSVAGESEYSFWHALIRDVAYSQIPRPIRSDKHRRAASWIELVAGERVEDHAEILAHHYTEALALARAAGLAGAPDLESPARRFLLLAGDRALGLETAKALAHYTRALDLTSPDDLERPAMLLRWADAGRQSGRHGEAAEALRGAIAGFEEQGDRLGVARAMVMLSNVLVYSGDPGGHQLAEEAVARLEAEPPGPDLVTGYSQVASLRMRRGAYAEAIEWADRAVSLAAELGLEEPIRALSARGTSRCCLGDPEGLEEERRALAAAVERGLGREAAVLYNNMAVDLASVAGPGEALRTLEEGIRFAESRGIEEWVLWMKTGLINNRLGAGEWDRIEADAVPLAERLESGGMMIPLIWVRWALARLFLLRGESQEAAPRIDWALEAARTAGGADEKPAVFSLAALSRLWAGEPDRARELLEELDRADLHANDNYVACLPEMVQTAIAAGDPELAERLADGVQPLYPMHENNLLTVQALLAEARGEHEEAIGLFERAARRWESHGDVWEQSQALLGLGRCLLARGDTAEARRVLAEARDIFVRLDARPSIATTDALLQQATARSS